MPAEMFESLENNLAQMKKTRIKIFAKGHYPKKKGNTKVSHVAKYQNDGTEKIEPANFVERAEKRKDWARLIDETAASFMKDGDKGRMRDLGETIAEHVGEECDRIDTGRLKRSFRYRITSR